jgi:poly-D-alanine transfer protein DltD
MNCSVNIFNNENYYYSKKLDSEIKLVKDENLSADFSNKPEAIKIIKKHITL